MELDTKKWIDKHFDGDIKGKNIIVTGANAGIGFEFCRDALYKGANIFMAVRSLQRGQDAKDKLINEFPDANIEIIHLDVASFQSIDEFVETIKEKKIDADVFFANAGVFALEQQIVYDKYERTFLVNYLSNYILINKLLPYFLSLNHEVRIILQCSLASYTSKVNDNDYQSINNYEKMVSYSNSKLYIGQLHYYLSHTINSNVTFLLTHPGATYTQLVDNIIGDNKAKKLMTSVVKKIFHSPSKASLSSFVLLNKNIKNGDFYGPRGLFHLSGYPKKNNICITKRKKYQEIIKYSEKITNLTF